MKATWLWALAIAGIIVSVVVLLVAMVSPAMAASTIQIPASGWDYLGGKDSPATWSRLGQRVTLNDGEIYCLGYRLCKVGEPTGDVVMSVRDSETDAVLWSQVWGDASELPDANNNTYTRVFCSADYLVKVDGDVRICVEYYGGNATDYVKAGYYAGDKITGQWYTNYVNYATDVSGWHDIGEAEEAAYYMSYTAKDTEPVDGDGNTTSGGISMALWVVIIAVPITAGLSAWYVMSKRRRGS